MESNRPMTCILRLDTQSPGWEKSLTKVIKRVKDLSYSIDATHGILRISGEIDPSKLLMDIKKAGKHAVLIQADCGGGHAHFNSVHRHSNNGHGYDYDGGYGKMESHPYPYYEAQAQSGHVYIQSDPHRFNALPAPAAERNHAPLLARPSAPPLHYDPYNPNCNMM